MHVFAANAIGDCTGDNFVVSGTNNQVPVICGENSGQHSKYEEWHSKEWKWFLLYFGWEKMKKIFISIYSISFQFSSIWQKDVLPWISILVTTVEFESKIFVQNVK